jgi:hypothetical protein
MNGNPGRKPSPGAGQSSARHLRGSSLYSQTRVELIVASSK